MTLFRAAFAFALVITLLVFIFSPRPITEAREDLMLALAPSAARATSYGDAHFNAMDPRAYDIERAEKMYRAAEEMDAAYPTLQHQLARIEFLRKNFPAALGHIDREIELYAKENPNSYYIRALILGYMGRYMDAAADYETYFKLAPANWAGINDYAWVLLKARLPEGALAAVEWGLNEWPDNPWLLHNKVIALYELGRFKEAATTAEAAIAAVETISREGWLLAYPGNDPLSAPQGLASFKQAVAENAAKAKAKAAATAP